MNKNNKRSVKKLMVAAICLGVLVSPFSSVTTGFAAEVLSQFNEKILGKPADKPFIQVPNKEGNITVNANEDLEKFKGFTSESSVAHTEKEYQPKVNPATSKSFKVDNKKSDLFNLSKQQIEDLVTKGYSVDDIYKIDELANKLLIDPQTIITRKEGDKLDWAKLGEVLQQEKDTSMLQVLIKEHPSEYQQIKNEKLTDQNKILLLSSLDQGKGSITDLLSTFKSKGEKAVTNYESAKSVKVESQSTNSSDSTDIDPNVLTRLKGISEKTGTPLNELISKYKSAKDLSKNVLVEKE
ncbi:hypothetical protein [Paenibacillus sp. SN-8-1]|uniref:hypothetical protein n=1 Tax=Paenibacillus sp. SN-8-1 TaxID=3435409 RepID=UPI003D9AB0A5